MRKDQNESEKYDVAVAGMRAVVRILIIICVVMAVIFVGRRAYQLGYDVFHQVPVDEGTGREVKVTVSDDMTVEEIGDMLRNSGLLKESTTVFRLQELVSDYHNKIEPGTYTLRTGMTADEMLHVMAGGDEETEEEGS